ncbi:MAG: PhpK family radical SAM P-methyltransferase, partial [Candidatus Anammoxibacter sp.]
KTMATDCLIIGFNDSNFEEYVKMLSSMGTELGPYRDLNTSFIHYNGKPYRALDILTHFYFMNKPGLHKPFINSDFLWPVITFLGTYLAKKGLCFDYVKLFQAEKGKLKELLKDDNLLTVAITTTLYVSPHPILEIISFIRRYNDKVKIIVGGPYIFNMTTIEDTEAIQRQFKYIDADFYIISQEGEQALANIIKSLKNGSGLEAISNIAYKEGGRYIIRPILTEDNLLDENMVNYSLFPKDDVGEFVSVRTAKSCPFSCAYCGFPKRAGKYKFLGVDMVEKEMDAIKAIGAVTTLSFIDDSFNVPLKRFKEILRMMIRNNYGFHWNSFFRCDYGDDETVALMKDAGCEGVVLGVESGSNDMLKRMNKTLRRKHFLEMIPLLKKFGILTYAGLIIGFPGETNDTVRETIDLIEESKPDLFRAQLWYCDPLTPIWDKRKEYGIKGSAFNWSHDTMDSKTAIELVENLFLSVKNSTWLPQYGFELWSIFYLMRKGMTRDQVIIFIKCFNAVVTDKLLSSGREIRPELMQNLQKSCMFDIKDMAESGAMDNGNVNKSFIGKHKYDANEVFNFQQ